MDLTLYHYVHCPFCVRVRLALGFLALPWKSLVLPYDDEKTPVALTGKKMLPIAVIDGKAMNESLDIIARIDSSKKLAGVIDPALEHALQVVGEHVHNLVMPYWIWTPEFNESSRQYFQKKKEIKRGPFEILVKRRQEFEAPVNEWLAQHESLLRPYWKSERLSISDLALAAHLWGLHLLPNFTFPSKWHDYLQMIQAECRFNYLMDIGERQ